MIKQLSIILLFIMLSCAMTAYATDHNIYPASNWRIENNCRFPVLFTIIDEDGHVEVQKVLQAGELYNQNMSRERTMGHALRDPTFSSKIDFRMGSYWEGFSGGIHIYIPFRDTDCM